MLHVRNMGCCGPERKGKYRRNALSRVGTQRDGRYTLFRRFAKIRGDSKGFDVEAKSGTGGIGSWARGFAPFALIFAVSACSGLPQIEGAPLPPPKGAASPVYRDLADIPAPPARAAPEMNQAAVQALTEDRAKTAQAAEDLRRQPFDQPDSATQPGF